MAGELFARVAHDHLVGGPSRFELRCRVRALSPRRRVASKEEHGVIHVDFPMALLKEWIDTGKDGGLSFHSISGQDANGDSS
jgi:hypothetical protein